MNPTQGTPLDQLLYRSDIAEGTRGDIIMFYNKVFISLIKTYALKFTPGENEVSIKLTLELYMKIHAHNLANSCKERNTT